LDSLRNVVAKVGHQHHEGTSDTVDKIQDMILEDEEEEEERT
jgi:hypothetical protein